MNLAAVFILVLAFVVWAINDRDDDYRDWRDNNDI
jgi:hypothetical protein